MIEVPSDRVGSSFCAESGQLTSDLHDRFGDRRRQRMWRGPGATRTRLKRRIALVAVTGDELGDPTGRDAVGAGNLAYPPTFEDNCGDDEPSARHPRASAECFLCRERCVSYVLTYDTAGGTV